ncbi:uncharacterized protein LOC125652485 [Ostrea edulis]|uniref:uncharacterized protein LOC125652485 n=1 Tax=Ostrea edulis TaxID=37623 RepID=UPI0020952231|nr:uncharacterized protein LOC125652485 [Ostrea edulis]XP_056021911.1 uncharacterized protein LOC125652485 [Ostrea edulis]
MNSGDEDSPLFGCCRIKRLLSFVIFFRFRKMKVFLCCIFAGIFAFASAKAPKWCVSVWGGCRGRHSIDRMPLDPAHKPAPQLPCDFNFYDLDRDGLVPRDEFNLATAAYQNYEMSKSYDVFSIMDVDSDGTVKIQEFVESIPRLRRQFIIGSCV